MTISINISVNGDYKCPITFKQGDREVTEVVSGRGHEGPKNYYIPFYHGPDIMTISVGPEEKDNGEEGESK